MTPLAQRLTPDTTRQIRADHRHAMAIHRRYRADLPAARKRALVDTVCLALEVHAQLEEELLYPALREHLPGHPVLERSVPEHQEMRRLIATLRLITPADVDFDPTFHALMRHVIHHVADEETELLPAAERVMPEALDALAPRLAARRAQLIAPRAGEVASNAVHAMPSGLLVMLAAGLGFGAALLWRGRRPRFG
jgi:hypothetical protein